MKDRIELVADILMGAAHTDNKLHGEEKRVITQLLEGLTTERVLSARLLSRIEGFSPKQFNLGATAAAFAKDTRGKKRALLQLVVAVNDADEEYDLEEDQYLRKVAEAIGLDKKHFADLLLDIVEESGLEHGLQNLRFT